MTTGNTTLLGLALPVQGELSGTWGDVINNYLTQYLDSAIAGTNTLTTDANVVLSKTSGAALTTASSQYAVLLCTGARTAIRTITVPAASQSYTIVNRTTGGFAVKIIGASGPAVGVTVANGTVAQVVWDGSDFVSTTVVSGAAGVAGNILTSTGTVFQSGGGAATTPVVVAFSATAMAVNCLLSNVFTVTLSANITTAPTLTNPIDGQTINWFFLAGTGGYTIVWPTIFKWSGGVIPVLSTAAGAVDLLVITYRSTTGFWYASLAKAFS
jgi:hypothetical protein